MFKRVETEEEARIFRQIYSEIFQEENYELEEFSPEGIRYLFYYGTKPVGTMEIMPYKPHVFSTVESEFSFLSVPIVKKNQKTVWEVDKVGFLKPYRKKGILLYLYHALYEVFQKHPMTHMVCLFEYRFFRLMRILSNAHSISAVGKSYVPKGERNHIVPTVIDANELEVWYRQKFTKKAEELFEKKSHFSNS